MRNIAITKKQQTLKAIFMLMILSLTFTSCTKDDPESVEEEEVITTMTITLTAGSESVTLKSEDLDGDGPNPPIISVVGNLAANTVYTGSIELLNETESPAEDITEEVEEEADEHQFFFNTTGAIVSTTYADEDGNGNPLGLSFNLTTGNPGSGTLQVILRHEPKKPNTGQEDAGGSTDISQTFTVTVE